MDEDKNPLKTLYHRERLERLGRLAEGASVYNPRYTPFIRRLRILLPIIAAIAITVTVVWSSIEPEDIVAVEKTQDPVAAGKNELLNPRFESADEKGQPYKITAERATQDAGNEKLIRLNKPFADIFLNEGNWVALEAEEGEFTQDERQLLLQGNVKLFHDKGYQLLTRQLAIDLQNSTAQTDTAVNVQGPTGTLDAAGLKGYAKEGRLVFNGPVKLVLNTEGNNLGGIIPQ